jgi:alkanesulfonate monooxygenase SsuD/methylene tetrahydromethanopterin reductase-like flavin-dependent oxidoreductase (luciferase family)
MKLGIGLFSAQRRPDDDRPWGDLYDEMTRLVEATEAAGLYSVWVSEHHFADDGYLPSLLPTLGTFAGRTDEVEIGTWVALAPFYNAVRLAEDATVVDLLADGRLTLGLSLGYRDREFEWFGVPKDERPERLVEAVELLRRSWSPGSLDYDPKFHTVSPDTVVTPEPDLAPPILLGGVSKPAVRRAARLGDAWGAPVALSLDDVKTRWRDIQQVRDEEGRDDDFDVYAAQYAFLGDSREDAWERMKEGCLYTQRTYDGWEAGEDLDELSAERQAEIRENAIFGTPAQVADRLADYREVLGDDGHVILRVDHPGVDLEAEIECIERLGDEVVGRI